MNNIKFYINDQNYPVLSATLRHGIDSAIATRTAGISIMGIKNIINIKEQLSQDGGARAKLYITDTNGNEKLYIDNTITIAQLGYSLSATETRANISIIDRFGLLVNDNCYVKDVFQKTTTSAIGLLKGILKELGLDKNWVYKNGAKSIDDLIQNETTLILTASDLQQFNSNTEARQVTEVIGEILGTKQTILNSNGYDKINIETPDGMNKISDSFSIKTDPNTGFISSSSGIASMSKTMGNISDPSVIYILPNGNGAEDNVDGNTYEAIRVNYRNGMPGVRKYIYTNTALTPQNINTLANYQTLGYKVQANSYIYNTIGKIFDANNEFYRPNRLIVINDEASGISEEMIVREAVTQITPQGISTSFNVCAKSVFSDSVNQKQRNNLIKK